MRPWTERNGWVQGIWEARKMRLGIALGITLGIAGAAQAAPPAPAIKTGYLVFLSQRQIESLADAAIGVADEADPLKAMRAAKVKDLVDADHSVDIALFGRMVADSADLNVDAACQVAHAISVHEANPEYDFYTAVDDAKSRNEDEVDAGAGMMGTVGFLSSTFYRYAVINVDQLLANLGSAEAASRAITAFMQSFINAMPSGKQNTFANGTRPAAVLVTLAEGQPTSLVGAFEQPTAATMAAMPLVPAMRGHAGGHVIAEHFGVDGIVHECADRFAFHQLRKGVGMAERFERGREGVKLRSPDGQPVDSELSDRFRCRRQLHGKTLWCDQRAGSKRVLIIADDPGTVQTFAEIEPGSAAVKRWYEVTEALAPPHATPVHRPILNQGVKQP